MDSPGINRYSFHYMITCAGVGDCYGCGDRTMLTNETPVSPPTNDSLQAGTGQFVAVEAAKPLYFVN